MNSVMVGAAAPNPARIPAGNKFPAPDFLNKHEVLSVSKAGIIQTYVWRNVLWR